MIIYFIVLFLISFAISGSDPHPANTGAKWVFTKDAMNQMIRLVIMPSAENLINGLAIPDISGTGKTSVGKVEYEIKDTRLTNFMLTTGGAELNSQNNTAELVVVIDGLIQLNYSYSMMSFPYTSDVGSASIYINAATMAGVISFGRDDVFLLTIGLSSASVDVSNFDMVITSDKAWLYDLIFNVFNNQITETLNSLLSEALRASVDAAVKHFLTWTDTMYNTQVGALLDISYTNPNGLTVYDDWITVGLSWFTVPVFPGYDPRDRTPFGGLTEVPPFDEVNDTSMFQIMVSKQRVNELLVIQYSTGFTTGMFYKGETNGAYFENSFWSPMFDMSRYNDVTSWSYEISTSGDISMEFLASAIRVMGETKIRFFDQNHTERCQAEVQLCIAAQPKMGKRGLTLSQEINSISSILMSDGQSVSGSGLDSVKTMLNSIYAPFVNSQLDLGGFPYSDKDLTEDYYIESIESYKIVPDNGADGYLVYSMTPKFL